MIGFGQALARAMAAPTVKDLEVERIQRELMHLHWVLERREADLETLAKLVGMLKESIRDRQERLARITGGSL